MDAILATIDEGGRGIVAIYREGVNICFLLYCIDSTKTLR